MQKGLTNGKRITISLDDSMLKFLIKESGRRAATEGKSYNYADLIREAINGKYGEEIKSADQKV